MKTIRDICYRYGCNRETAEVIAMLRARVAELEDIVADRTKDVMHLTARLGDPEE